MQLEAVLFSCQLGINESTLWDTLVISFRHVYACFIIFRPRPQHQLHQSGHRLCDCLSLSFQRAVSPSMPKLCTIDLKFLDTEKDYANEALERNCEAGAIHSGKLVYDRGKCGNMSWK